ncbi:nucleophile aminohydrolase [Phlebopus sp. FC_14]|nr:nucleophile aminohydrolase [Phlebopus sp. FC_14]
MDRIDMNRLKSGEVNLGTSIMAVQFDKGVVIGADSRTTTGSYIVRCRFQGRTDGALIHRQANRVTDKLTHVHDRIYCCRSGSAADTQAVADIVHYYLQLYTQIHGAAPPVSTAAGIFQNLCYENKDALSAGIIVAGWDKEVGPSVYNIPLGGGLFRQPWAIGGSGSTYVYGYCDATYQEGWGRDETVDFVKNTLALAMSRDGSSGGVIRMCVITEEGVERLFVPGDQLPKFWEGREVLSVAVKTGLELAPMAVE